MPACPDAVFPNNWVSFHADGTWSSYPLLAPNRRLERRVELATGLADHGYHVTRVLDLTRHEMSGRFLEGTGSVVFDHCSRTCVCFPLAAHGSRRCSTSCAANSATRRARSTRPMPPACRGVSHQCDPLDRHGFCRGRARVDRPGRSRPRAATAGRVGTRHHRDRSTAGRGIRGQCARTESRGRRVRARAIGAGARGIWPRCGRASACSTSTGSRTRRPPRSRRSAGAPSDACSPRSSCRAERGPVAARCSRANAGARDGDARIRGLLQRNRWCSNSASRPCSRICSDRCSAACCSVACAVSTFARRAVAMPVARTRCARRASCSRSGSS